jgi:hypothetical protein
VVEADPEPDIIVECGFCHVTGPSSLIPEAGGMRRCFPDIDGCVRRSLQEGRPRPLLSSAELLAAAAPAEPLEPLPPERERALQRFNEATDAQDAAEAGENPSEGEEAAQDGEPAPVADEDVTPDGGEDA